MVVFTQLVESVSCSLDNAVDVCIPFPDFLELRLLSLVMSRPHAMMRHSITIFTMNLTHVTAAYNQRTNVNKNTVRNS